MRRVTIVSASLVLGSILAFMTPDNARAQAWQGEEEQNAASDWQQKVLKKPKQSQWHSAGQPANYEEPATVSEQPIERRPQSTVASQPAQIRKAARRPVSDRNVTNVGTMPQGNGRPGRQRVTLASGAEVIEPGPVVQPQPQQQFEPLAAEGEFANAGGCANCAGGCDSCGGEACDACESCSDPCERSGTRCIQICDGWKVFDGTCGPLLKGLSVFAGVDGFKGSNDYGKNGNFGLNEGLNLARPLGDPWGCGYQIGANFVQSDFSGAPLVRSKGYELDAAFRKQYFVTAGIFHRSENKNCGLQGGVAYDYMHDIYYQNTSLQQLRSETSLILNSEWQLGYYGAYKLSSDRVIDGRLDPTDMFIMYVRRNFENGGDGRLWAGATGKGDGLIGVDLWVPLGKGFALENRANYMIPKQGANETGQTRESWGLVMQLVWYPGQNAKCQQENPYRPMFNVADNSLFMVDRETR